MFPVFHAKIENKQILQYEVHKFIEPRKTDNLNIYSSVSFNLLFENIML